MELDELRQQIDDINSQMLSLFAERMRISRDIAQYKLEHGMEVFQGSREKQILDTVRENAPEGMENASELFFQTVMDISKCLQFQELTSAETGDVYKKADFSKHYITAIPGAFGSYSQMAADKLTPDHEPLFFSDFEDVFRAVESGRANFGVLPIANSTAGSVSLTYELLKKYDLRICQATKIKVSHCLAAKRHTKIEDVTIVYSHEQAIMQCSEFLRSHGLKAHHYANTALAAEYVSDCDEPYAAICSEKAARDLGLEILERDITDAKENYTKFILICKDNLIPEGANLITVSLALPHQKSALYRLLTKFSVAGLNLTMIKSRPVANTDFDAVFYLDFEGDVSEPNVIKLMNELGDELSYFKFLGNYKEI